MLTLYFAPGASSFAVHIALHEIGVPFEARPMSFRRNELRSQDYLPHLDARYARMMARPAVQRTIEIESAIGYELPA
jgi:glutathione S-transferase